MLGWQANLTRSMAGMRKASVFPVPVFALTTKSLPDRKTGRDAAWTCVQFWYCILFSALHKEMMLP